MQIFHRQSLTNCHRSNIVIATNILVRKISLVYHLKTRQFQSVLPAPSLCLRASQSCDEPSHVVAKTLIEKADHRRNYLSAAVCLRSLVSRVQLEAELISDEEAREEILFILRGMGHASVEVCPRELLALAPHSHNSDNTAIVDCYGGTRACCVMAHRSFRLPA